VRNSAELKSHYFRLVALWSLDDASSDSKAPAFPAYFLTSRHGPVKKIVLTSWHPPPDYRHLTEQTALAPVRRSFVPCIATGRRNRRETRSRLLRGSPHGRRVSHNPENRNRAAGGA
jgi:hypothetical protein